MLLGHTPSAFIENGPTEHLAKANAGRSTARAWRALGEARRLEVVERALSPANDCTAEFPLAL